MDFRKLSVALGCAGILGPASAFAGVITERHTIQPVVLSSTPAIDNFTLAAFDTHWGTLTGVTLQIVNATSAEVYIINLNQNGVSETYSDASTSVTLTVTGVDGTSASAAFIAGPYSGSVPAYANGCCTVTYTASGSADGSHAVPASGLGLYEALSPVPLAFAAAMGPGLYGGAGGPDVGIAGTATTGGEFSLVYTFTGVPEPSTWAMMGLGFAALGLAGYRSTRRRAARFAL